MANAAKYKIVSLKTCLKMSQNAPAAI